MVTAYNPEILTTNGEVDNLACKICRMGTQELVLVSCEDAAQLLHGTHMALPLSPTRRCS